MRLFDAMAITALCAVLAGCSPPAAVATPPTAAEIAYAETAAPADPALAARYARSCKLCHAVAGAGAPLVGSVAAWQPRMTARGIDGLLASVHGGRGAMPARGQCADCSDADYRALIAFMAGAKP
ncbi:c-type cytochrome [Novosphingobium sp.]|uniref:c-type cytochrome n=1 Tax=Novosphingobium sp. TaxID=1874826 RepID=UPI00333E6C21